MSQVLRSVVDYVGMARPGFAVLITGPWGCGKTYFWKRIAEPKLRQVAPSRRILYASLYGVRNARSIDTQLLLDLCSESVPEGLSRLAGFLRKRLGQLASGAARVTKALVNKYVGFDVSSLDLRWLIKAEDAIVCFDDLERCEMPMEEILGYINHFVEHCGSSVIVICNENEIGSDKEQKGKEDYRRMKEKTIGVSLAYRPDWDEVVPSLLAQFQSNASFYQYLTENSGLVRDLFIRSGADNIRAAHRALTTLQVIFDVLRSDGVDVKTVTKGLIYAVVPTSLEIHLGRGDPDAHRRIHSFKLMLAGSAFGGLRDVGNTYEKEFADRYLSQEDWQYAVGCRPACEYLITGHLDRASLVRQMKELFTPGISERKPYERLITNPMAMDDEEFQHATDQTLGEIQEGQVTKPGVLVGLFNAFQIFVQHRLIARTNEQIVQTFSEGLGKSIEQGTYEADSLFNAVALNHPSLEPPTPAAKTFRDEVLRVNEGALRLRKEKRVLEAKAQMTHDPKHFISQLVSTGESGLRYEAVFDKFDAQELTDWIVGLSNDLKRRLQTVLQNRYSSLPPDMTFAAEQRILKQTSDMLKTYSESAVNGKRTRMSTFLIGRLAETLAVAAERVQKQVGGESDTSHAKG